MCIYVFRLLSMRMMLQFSQVKTQSTWAFIQPPETWTKPTLHSHTREFENLWLNTWIYYCASVFDFVQCNCTVDCRISKHMQLDTEEKENIQLHLSRIQNTSRWFIFVLCSFSASISLCHMSNWRMCSSICWCIVAVWW